MSVLSIGNTENRKKEIEKYKNNNSVKKENRRLNMEVSLVDRKGS